MPDEYVTKLEMTNALAELRSEMKSGFSVMDMKLNQIINAMELRTHTDRETYDERYILREESMAEAVARVGTPQFRHACYPIVTEYLNTEDGKRQLGCIIDSHFAEKRDSATKWINFIKLVGGIIIAALLMYGGQTVISSNQRTQQAVIEAIENLGE
jgi:hypothetical protein